MGLYASIRKALKSLDFSSDAIRVSGLVDCAICSPLELKKKVILLVNQDLTVFFEISVLSTRLPKCNRANNKKKIIVLI